ncbi:MAG: sulfatase-like hydrolase/transferase [Bryobacterales bacterium]|nr:sulfatase-like hydrolase/transferase [Bryobacterales bacterium]
MGAANLILALLLAATLQAKPPNVLLLFADDQRPDTIGAHGNPHIRTPNLDRLAAAGFSFRRAYCLGSQGGAVCVPSRAMLNTGKSFFRIPMDLEGHLTLGQLLGRNGFATFATGKWHNGQPSWLKSFQQGRNIMFGGMSDHLKVPLMDLGPDGSLHREREGSRFSSTLFADAAIDFLRNHRPDRPFFAYVAFTAPHDPRNPPPKYRRMYYRNPPPLPPNFAPQHPFDNGHMTGRDENLGPWPRTRLVVQDQLSEYYGLITHLDKQVGRILRELRSGPHAEDTIVIYTADHGLAIGSHGLLGKQNVYEHSMGAPLIFSGPGIPAGGSSETFCYLLDIFPTLCAVLGIEMPAEIDGVDLSAVWNGSVESVRDSIFTSFRDLMKSVRDERWKLIRYPRINHSQLFDLASDPHETRDLGADPAQAARIAELTERMREWQAKVGDDHPLAVQNPQPKQIDLSGREQRRDKWQPEWIFEKYFEEPYGRMLGR